MVLMTTAELLKRCIAKDRGAWDEFTGRFTPLVKRSVSYKLNKLNLGYSRDQVEDIAQEVFLLIWEKDKLSSVRDTSSLKGWLAIVSLNITSNYCKKHIFSSGGRLLSLDEAKNFDSPGSTLSEVLSSEKLSTLKTLEANELKEIIDKELSLLPAKQQLALKFNIYDGEKQHDIARIMNVPAGTVATLIKRGKETLREKLKIHLDL